MPLTLTVMRTRPGRARRGGLGWADWVLLALVPVGFVLLAMLTARITVLAALKRML